MNDYITKLIINIDALKSGDTNQIALAISYVLGDKDLTDTQKVGIIKDIMSTASYAYFD